ncbi:tripartite ATP-independent transporter solute receptor, DctP family [Anaerovirgula multivorans]|uniref:Tripartite ATP-independent transporter solute receptor, DctP family n=1 Tax=Anaerovirgula multivorans TaxID=312168 RepID=A0A239CBI9_9FIRM|nr:DctP family TRAP transporter solute-binding subunit [Anaerovirgula multivorans]SNS17595.1 tripartite ATP-independent transporter solute receptor, DctP family [Anaerovirgula multivorans]
MSKVKRILAILMVGLMLVIIATGCSKPSTTSGEPASGDSEEKVVTLKFANVTSNSAKDAGVKFKEVVEAESNGSIKVNLFQDNQLGDDRVAIETTQFGDIDIAASSTSPLATMYADFYLFDAPYLFLSNEEAYAALDGEVGQGILNGLESMGLKGLTFWENGFRNFTNNTIAVSKPEDVRGLKIRTMENRVHLAAWSALGANPTPMAFTELFTALQQGTVDGQENPLGIIDANKFEEVQKYISLTQHVYTPYVVTMNLDKYNSLSDNQKAAIQKAVEASTKFQREASQNYEKEILENFEAKGVNIIKLTNDEKAEFQNIINDAEIFDLVKEVMDNPKYVDEILK